MLLSLLKTRAREKERENEGKGMIGGREREGRKDRKILILVNTLSATSGNNISS